MTQMLIYHEGIYDRFLLLEAYRLLDRKNFKKILRET